MLKSQGVLPEGPIISLVEVSDFNDLIQFPFPSFLSRSSEVIVVRPDLRSTKVTTSMRSI